MINNCNFQDLGSIEDMFANMDQQVQAYYQLQQNLDDEQDEHHDQMKYPDMD